MTAIAGAGQRVGGGKAIVAGEDQGGAVAFGQGDEFGEGSRLHIPIYHPPVAQVDGRGGDVLDADIDLVEVGEDGGVEGVNDAQRTGHGHGRNSCALVGAEAEHAQVDDALVAIGPARPPRPGVGHAPALGRAVMADALVARRQIAHADNAAAEHSRARAAGNVQVAAGVDAQQHCVVANNSAGSRIGNGRARTKEHKRRQRRTEQTTTGKEEQLGRMGHGWAPGMRTPRAALEDGPGNKPYDRSPSVPIYRQTMAVRNTHRAACAGKVDCNTKL
jgi:hypothetical protein